MKYARENYIKWASYAMLLLFIFLAQSSYRFGLSVFGIKPDLIPFFIAAVALFEGPGCAGVLGFFAGLLCDFTLSGIDGLFSFYYISFGVFLGFVAKKYFQKNIFSGLALGALSSLAQNLFRYLFYYALIFQAPFLSGMKISFTELGVSVALSPLVYVGVKLINGHFAVEDD